MVAKVSGSAVLNTHTTMSNSMQAGAASSSSDETLAVPMLDRSIVTYEGRPPSRKAAEKSIQAIQEQARELRKLPLSQYQSTEHQRPSWGQIVNDDSRLKQAQKDRMAQRSSRFCNRAEGELQELDIDHVDLDIRSHAQLLYDHQRKEAAFCFWVREIDHRGAAQERWRSGHSIDRKVLRAHMQAKVPPVVLLDEHYATAVKYATLRDAQAKHPGVTFQEHGLQDINPEAQQTHKYRKTNHPPWAPEQVFGLRVKQPSVSPAQSQVHHPRVCIGRFVTGQVHCILKDMQSSTPEEAVATGVMKDAFLLIFQITPSQEDPTLAGTVTGRIFWTRGAFQRYMDLLHPQVCDFASRGNFHDRWVLQTNFTVTVPAENLHPRPAVVLSPVLWKRHLQYLPHTHLIVAHVDAAHGLNSAHAVSIHAIQDDPALQYSMIAHDYCTVQLAQVHTAGQNLDIVFRFLDKSITTNQNVDVCQINLAPCGIDVIFSLLGPTACSPAHMLYHPHSGSHEWFLSMEQMEPLIGKHINYVDEECLLQGFTDDIADKENLLIFGEAPFLVNNPIQGGGRPRQILFKDVQVRLRVKRNSSSVVCIFTLLECLGKTVPALDGGLPVRLPRWTRDGSIIA
jgi:hypothetical protein